ncbi:MAG: hypothetical protein HUJ25_00045 [Crocinitomicaceae bacterium]|nr:hypothetical protein [Crocinitomicaceae bacterium]
MSKIPVFFISIVLLITGCSTSEPEVDNENSPSNPVIQNLNGTDTVIIDNGPHYSSFDYLDQSPYGLMDEELKFPFVSVFQNPDSICIINYHSATYKDTLIFYKDHSFWINITSSGEGILEREYILLSEGYILWLDQLSYDEGEEWSIEKIKTINNESITTYSFQNSVLDTNIILEETDGLMDIEEFASSHQLKIHKINYEPMQIGHFQFSLSRFYQERSLKEEAFDPNKDMQHWWLFDNHLGYDN